MDKFYRCDYVSPHSRVKCDSVMEIYPNSKAPGEYLYCDQDGNKKHIITVDAEWNDIIDKPDNFENAIYAILGMILDSASYGEFRDVDSIGRVKQYLNEVILKNLTTNFEIDTNQAINILNRYCESINGEEAQRLRENAMTFNTLAQKKRLEFNDKSTSYSVFGVEDDETAHDLYERSK